MRVTTTVSWRPNSLVAGAVAALVLVAHAGAGGEDTRPARPPASPDADHRAPLMAPYRAPLLALVQPAASSPIVPQDRAVIVLRFAQGEASDPVDVSSLRVTVDGSDRTRLFQITGTEAWGPLSLTTLSIGTHQLSARICSSRGACSEINAAVIVTGATTRSSARLPPPEFR